MNSNFKWFHKKIENKPFKDHLFYGPYQPCEIFQSNINGCYHLVVRKVIGGDDIIFPSMIDSITLENWMERNGYSKASVSFDGKIKVSF